MSLAKVALVAHRELWENVRTKGFWIGICAVPLIIAASVLVPMLLAKAKDARPYAVIDQSGWLLAEVETRARFADARAMLEIVRREAAAGPAKLESLPRRLRELAPAVEGASDVQLDALARTLVAAEGVIAAPDGASGASDAALATCREQSAAFIEWYDALTPVVARSIGEDLDRSRFHRIMKDARSEEDVRAALDEGAQELFAYLVIGDDPVSGSIGSKYVSNNRTDGAVRGWFSRLASDSVRRERFSREGVAPDVAGRIQQPLVFEEKQIGDEGEETKVATKDKLKQWAPPVFTYILWFSIFISAQMLLTNTIEEKSNRLMEVLLSSMSPLDLMIGKTLGTAATGLAMVGSWILFGAATVTLLPKLLGAGQGIDLITFMGEPAYVAAFLGYYLLGYLLYSTAFCAIGSLCSSLKDAQNLIQPVMITLMIPLFALIPVTQDPNGTVARVLSFIPPFTPFVMMNRAAGPPATWEYFATLALLVASILAAFYLSAKIFRIGVLMTGQPPKLMEVLRLLKAPVGTPRTSAPPTSAPRE